MGTDGKPYFRRRRSDFSGTVTTPQSPPTKVAKIVDLDPDQQSITQLYRVVITLALPGGRVASQAKWQWPKLATCGSGESPSVRA